MNTSIHQKIIRASIGALIEGRKVDTVLKCSDRQRIALENAYTASLNLRETLSKADVQLNEVADALKLYDTARIRFETVFNFSWPA